MKEWFEFVGLMLGDGCMGNRVGSHQYRRESSRFYSSIKDKEELREKILIPVGVLVEGSKPYRNAVAFNVGVGLTEKLGWSNGKIVPKLSDFTDEELACVLRGCFESDGGVHLQRGKYKAVQFGNTDLKLVEFVYEGLKNLGISSKITKSIHKNLSYKPYFMVYVHVGKGNLNLFSQKVGFITERKRNLLKQ